MLAMSLAAEKRALRRLYWSSFALRAGLGLFAWIISSLYDLKLIEDAGQYSSLAAEVAQNWLAGRPSDWLDNAIAGGRQAWLIVACLAVFYLLSGGYEAIPVAIVLQSLITAATPNLAYRCARGLGIPADGALFTGRLLAYSPAFVFWAGALYKEGVILCILFLVIDHTLRLQKKISPRSVVVVGLSIIGMFGLRFYMGAILAAAILFALVFGRRQARETNPFALIVRQVIVFFLVVIVFVFLGFGSQIEQFSDMDKNLQQINSSRRDLASYNSGYLRDVDVSSPLQAIQFLPVGLAYFLTVPLPWHIGSTRQNMTILETFLWVVIVYPFAIRGVFRSIRVNSPGTIFLIFTLMAICTLYALFIGNIGTAYRVRVQVWAIIALFAGWGWSIRNARRKKIRERAKKLVDKSIRPADLSLAPSSAPRLSLPGPGVGPA
jgi:NADH:ubiquinone oxidoreductase subunit 6 (subunit J)